ncbi:MAG: hypothetical protein GY754_40540 [bacterium]|nr:hypothetical protein [bacterium]
MKFHTNISKSILIVIILCLSTCGSKSVREEREKAILKQYSVEKKDKYANLLVNINDYTSNGKIYHGKYHKYLISIAEDISENKKLIIANKSVGFYFDNKTDNKENLYLGLDIEIQKQYNEQYSQVALALLKEHIKDIITTINSCKTIFDEKEVIGMVIGFKWKNSGREELINMWIRENDVLQFEKNKLTLNELVQISTITDTSGKTILLLL